MITRPFGDSPLPLYAFEPRHDASERPESSISGNIGPVKPVLKSQLPRPDLVMYIRDHALVYQSAQGNYPGKLRLRINRACSP